MSDSILQHELDKARDEASALRIRVCVRVAEIEALRERLEAAEYARDTFHRAGEEALRHIEAAEAENVRLRERLAAAEKKIGTNGGKR